MDIFIRLYPIMVVQSRYGGTYEGGEWHALPNADAAWLWSDAYSEYMFDGDEQAINFWHSADAEKIGRGDTPNAAVLDLLDRHSDVGQLEYDAGQFHPQDEEVREDPTTKDDQGITKESGTLLS